MTVVAAAQSRYSAGEWESRVELAAAYRIVDHYGMSDIANQVLSVRVRDEPDCFLLHPYGMLFDEVRASDFVKVRLDGTVVDGPGIWTGSGAADFTQEGAGRWISDGSVNLGQWIFGTRPDVNAFVHGHCEDIQAVSATGKGLRPVSQAAVYLGNHIDYLDYDFAEDDDYAERFVRTIAMKDIIVSRHHGYYTMGKRASAAFFRAYYLRQACTVQVKAGAAAAGFGDTVREIDPQRVAMIQDQMADSPHYHYDGTTEWAALLRKLERDSPDYRT